MCLSYGSCHWFQVSSRSFLSKLLKPYCTRLSKQWRKMFHKELKMCMEQTLGPVGSPSHCDRSDDHPSLEILSIRVLCWVRRIKCMDGHFGLGVHCPVLSTWLTRPSLAKIVGVEKIPQEFRCTCRMSNDLPIAVNRVSMLRGVQVFLPLTRPHVDPIQCPPTQMCLTIHACHTGVCSRFEFLLDSKQHDNQKSEF